MFFDCGEAWSDSRSWFESGLPLEFRVREAANKPRRMWLNLGEWRKPCLQGGIDIVGIAKDGSKKLIAEVKTTHMSATVGLRGPQKNAIERDLERLTKVRGNLRRYLIVISEHTKKAIEKQIRAREKFPLVTVIDAIGPVDLPALRETDESE